MSAKNKRQKLFCEAPEKVSIRRNIETMKLLSTSRSLKIREKSHSVKHTKESR
ncbi:hypothetical protein [Hydrocoleum sp. CS-953]|uniref:hypothetical protein n=1 Tax=Hydrocoleum sp. CS-953 TaxID=1671698 RepID=UPI00143D8621|nr:hypothetical protein [Hydrocoleum sp. CS-953]